MSEETKQLNLDKLLTEAGPSCLIVIAELEPVGGMDRFQPAGFPEVGHVIYPAPRKGGQKEDVDRKSVV